MKKITIFMLCGFLLVVGIACQTEIPYSPTFTPEPMYSGWASWLDQPVCMPPCWQNITPGETSKDIAVSILKNIPDVVITYDGKYGLSWDFTNHTDSGEVRVSEDGVVSTIWLGSISEQKVPLRMVVNTYGFPQYLKPYDCREGRCSTALIYPDLGMFLSVYVSNIGTTSNPRFEILADTSVNRVYFIKKGLENFEKIPDFQDYDLLTEWGGYREYP